MNLFRSLVRVLRRKTELAEELESHLRMAVADRVARGESAADAHREVMREFGNVPLIADVTRERWGWIWVEDFLQDVRYGFRTLLKQRSFTFVTVLTLALGIGACTAIFSLVNAVLLRSLPYGAPESLVYLYTPNSHFKIPIEAIPPSNADFFDLQRISHSIEAMTLFEQKRYDVAVGDLPQRVGGATVDANFFKTLRSSPELGRVIQEGDESGGDNRVVVISHGLWQSMFGGRADALGSMLRLNGAAYRVIGIMPSGFGYPHRNDLPFGDGHIEMTQLWLPSALTPQQKLNRDDSNGYTIARLKPGVTLHEAQAEMSTIMSHLDSLHDAVMRGWGAYIASFLDSALGPVRPLMWLLTGAVGFVLLIACGNAANLLLARAANRTHELGMRATLGARRGRLLRQMLTESLMLSGAAGIAGIVLAWVFLHAMLRLNPGNIPRMQEATLDLRVMAFLVFVTLLTGLLFGMLPSFSASRIHLTEFLKSGGMHGIAGGRRRLRNGLAVAQVALVVMLLTGAGLLVRSYEKVLAVQTGFSPSTLSARLQPGPRYDTREKRQNLIKALLDKVQSIHGVEAAGMVSHLPLSNSESVSTIWVEGYANQENQMTETRDITTDYLSAMRTPLLTGRSFTEDDDARGARVVIVNEALAKKYLGGKDVVGRHLRINTDNPWSTVIGLAADVRNEELEVAAVPQIYFPLGQGDVYPSGVFLAVRSSLPQDAIVSAVRAAVRDIDPNISIEDVHAMGELVSQAEARRRFQTTLLTVFSGIAMFLAVVGVYGLLAYSVRQRTGEIGIRMALGSSKSGVVRLVLREGLGLLVVGLVIGLAGAFGCARLLNGFLYGVPALDPVTFVLVPVLLLVATLGACLVPSVRAAAIDPMQALRHE
jgi:predicted permease